MRTISSLLTRKLLFHSSLILLLSNRLLISLPRLSKLAELAKCRAVKVQQPNTDNTNNTQPTKETRALCNAQIVKQRVRKQDTSTSKRTSKEVIRSKQTSSVLWITERNVDEDGLHDDEHCSTVDCDADGGHDPVDGGAGGPGEEEEADGGADGGGQGRDEPVFLDGPAELFDAGVHPVVEVGCVDCDADDAGDEDAEEDEADLAEVHAVEDGVDEGEDLEDCV